MSPQLVLMASCVALVLTAPSHQAQRWRQRQPIGSWGLLRGSASNMDEHGDDARILVGFKNPVRLANKLSWFPARQYNDSLHGSLVELDKRRGSYVVSPLSNQLLELDDLSRGKIFEDDLLGLTEKYRLSKGESSRALNADHCQTVRSPIVLTRDEVEPTTGKLLRTCKGSVQLNRCEGSCWSSVQPSVKSRDGFKKECRCCNEDSFKRIVARLDECLSAESSEVGGFMDVEVDEPMDCKCRRCDS